MAVQCILFLINPFQKITGWYALILGIIVTLLMSFVCYHTGFYIFNILNIAHKTGVLHPKVPFTFWLVLYQNVISIFVLSLTYYFFAKLFQQKNLRISDFFGMVSLARLPLLLIMAGVISLMKVEPNLHYLDIRPNIFTAIYTLFVNIIIFWQLALYFYALKEASGLSGNKLIISVFCSLVIVSAVTERLTMLFVY